MVTRLRHGKKAELRALTFQALGRSCLLTGQVAALKKSSRLTVPDKIPYLLQGWPVTLADRTPSWSSTPMAYSLAVAVSSLNNMLPVSAGGANITIAWHSSSVPSTKPTWISFADNGTSAPKISFTSPPDEDVSSMILSATANGQTVNSDPGTVTVSATVVSGTWVPLNVASHSRYIPTAQNTTTTDNATPVTATYIPLKAWQTPFLSSDGKLYYFGGMHSDYPGNDIDVLDLAAMGSGTTIPAQQLHRPRVPPAGDSGYGSGGTPSLYKNYSPALSDKTDWQPYARHYYTGAVPHPTLGLLVHNWFPVNPNTGAYSLTTWPADGYPTSSKTYWGDYDGRSVGAILYDGGKYTLHAAFPAAAGRVDANYSDYCSVIDGFLVFDTQPTSTLNVYECSYRTSQAMTLKRSVSSAYTGMVGSSRVAIEGCVVRWLYGWKFVVLHKQGDSGYHTLKLYDHWDNTASSACVTNIALPSGVSLVDGGNLAIAVDRTGNRLFLAEFRTGNIPRFFVSRFDQLGTWSELTFTNTPTVTWQSFPTTGVIGREPLVYWNNQLFLIDAYDNGQKVRWYRVTLDGGITP